MKIGILGGLFPNEIRKEIEAKSSGPIQYAADALQWSIVRGLDYYSDDISLVNLPYVGSYPKRYKDLKIKTFTFSHNFKSTDYNIGFINLPLYKLYSRYKAAKDFLKNRVGDQKEILLVYSMHSPFLLAAVAAKKKNPELKICLIVPDLPEFMGNKQNLLFDAFKRIEKKMLDRALLQVDAFVILSKYMVQPLNVGKRPWVCVEGIYSEDENKIEIVKDKCKNIFYSGTLASRYGIKNLLSAFKAIQDDNYRLWICGDGDTRDEIIASSKLDKRIVYYGQLPRERVLKLQKEATVVVNPRTSEGVFTKYSFPSKTMEYLASGTPCVICRLPGIPEEYFDYCYVLDKETPTALRDMLVWVCEKPPAELHAFGLAAHDFIIRNKTAIPQGGKIFKMLQQL